MPKLLMELPKKLKQRSSNRFKYLIHERGHKNMTFTHTIVGHFPSHTEAETVVAETPVAEAETPVTEPEKPAAE